jgi:hypothetical protein
MMSSNKIINFLGYAHQATSLGGYGIFTLSDEVSEKETRYVPRINRVSEIFTTELVR